METRRPLLYGCHTRRALNFEELYSQPLKSAGRQLFLSKVAARYLQEHSKLKLLKHESNRLKSKTKNISNEINQLIDLSDSSYNVSDAEEKMLFQTYCQKSKESYLETKSGQSFMRRKLRKTVNDLIVN